MSRWSNYLARRERRKKTRKNKLKWVPYLSHMSTEEIELELLDSYITTGYRTKLNAELEIRRETKRNRLIYLTLGFAALSAALSLLAIILEMNR